MLLWRDAHKRSTTAGGQRVGLTGEIRGSLGQEGSLSDLGRLGLISGETRAHLAVAAPSLSGAEALPGARLRLLVHRQQRLPGGQVF